MRAWLREACLQFVLELLANVLMECIVGLLGLG